MSILSLADRTTVRLSGTDAESLLQRLITTDLDDVAVGEAGFGALLTPQGKIIMDFLVIRQEDGFLFDMDKSIEADFIKKMTLYRMRSDVAIEPQSLSVGVVFDEQAGAIRDPRSDLLGWRVYGENEDGEGNGSSDSEATKDYHSRHIKAGIPRAGVDFAYGDVFPHDINMDFLQAIDFEKGCYVGQEVVSRMQHRGTARRRLVMVHADQALPETGTEITASGKPCGTLGAVAGHDGLALVRLDRASDAKKEGLPLLADGIEVTIDRPSYASYEMDL